MSIYPGITDTETNYWEIGDVRYTEHMNVKLTKAQAAAIRRSGETDSQWLREAAQMRLDSGE